ncbi:MAG: alpha/beta hydrolase-fold protein [Microscillaceae bacterium]
MPIILITLLLGAGFAPVFAQSPQVSQGQLQRLENFASQFVQARNIDIWLPPGYSNSQRYAVLYMHDGQMLFDSTTTWNKQEWGVDEILGTLQTEGKMRPCIVVGMWNTGATRHSEYFPQKPQQLLPKVLRDSLQALELKGQAQADAYLKFIVRELKPFIDKNFSVHTDAAHTFVMGSSMGGLISMYALAEYPQVFGGAGCLSTHWPGSLTRTPNIIPEAFNRYLAQKLPKLIKMKRKIYFDYGTATLDSLYPPLQAKIDETMRQAGFPAAQWTSRKFEGEDHSERAWRKRLAIPVLFLMGI